MYATLALERELQSRGMRADFRATGQTGIFIAGAGVPIDAVVADFISGAAEWISPARDDGGWDLVEGQRSEEHTSELQSLMRTSYAVFCLKKKNPSTQRAQSLD